MLVIMTRLINTRMTVTCDDGYTNININVIAKYMVEDLD